MASRLIIIGAGGHGRVVADAAECMAAFDEIVFVDQLFPQLRSTMHWPVVAARVSELPAEPEDEWVVGVGDCRARLRIQCELESADRALATVIHPSAVVSRHAVVGAGSVVMAGVCVNVGSVLGRAVIVNTGATVDHDCHLADGVHVSPGVHLAGSVQVGACAWVGIGASVRQGLRIGEHALVGAGAAVVRNVSAGALAVGVPAQERPRT